MVQMKADFIEKAAVNGFLYIPHGSDERKKGGKTLQVFPSLYIPHGSDESIVNSGDERHLSAFISHMVQMKVTRPSMDGCPKNNLYIPHGSDESQKSLYIYNPG